MADLESPSKGRIAVAFQDGTKPYGPSETPGGSFAFTVISQYPWRTGCRTPLDEMFKSQTSLFIQWLRLYASSSESMGLMPVWGTKIPHATIRPKLKTTKKKKSPNKTNKKRCSSLIVSSPYPGVPPPRVQRTTERQVCIAFVIHHGLKSGMQQDRKGDGKCIRKNLCGSRSEQFKPMLFKGQVCLNLFLDYVNAV